MTYESNVMLILANVNKKLTKASDVSKLQRTIATYLRASNLQRITEGIAVNGQMIGQYDTASELYVNPLNAPRKFPTVGKTGRAKFKNGKPHRTGYFRNYKEFRARIGRPTGVVNLQLSGRLFKTWIIGQQGRDWVIGFNSEYGTNVAKGNEARFGKKIFGVSGKDREQIKLIEKDFVNKALSNA